MKQRLFAKTALTAAVLATLSGCASQADTTAPSWQADETYKLTILHTNDHHGRFWQNKYGEYGMAARKTLLDRSVPKWQLKVVQRCFCQVVISIQVYLSLIYKTQNLISKA